MKSRKIVILLGLAIVALFAGAMLGCMDKASFETLESSRKVANENALFNAQKYRQNHPEYASFSISARGDSRQSTLCLQGDGWASVELEKIPDGRVKLQCSTVSEALGCVPTEDFKGTAWGSQKDHCDRTLPDTLPVIQK